MASKLSYRLLILIVACVTVYARVPVKGLIREIIDEVESEMKAEADCKPAPHPFGGKKEVEEVEWRCDPDYVCGVSGCCPYPVKGCDANFICCDPCTGNICGTSEWACDQAVKSSAACQNRKK